jgi:hypothetical protein
MTITEQATIAAPDLDEAWRLYADIFAEVNELAAERHLMTADEFTAVYHNPQVLKFYVHDEAGRLAGMSVLTQHLDAWPLISPPYFARHWPEHYARKAIWYVAFVGVAPHMPNGFRELVRGMYTHVIANAGIAVMDFCTYNVTHRRLPAITLKLLGWINPAATMQIADTQSFVVYRFDQAGT